MGVVSPSNKMFALKICRTPTVVELISGPLPIQVTVASVNGWSLFITKKSLLFVPLPLGNGWPCTVNNSIPLILGMTCFTGTVMDVLELSA